MKVLLTTLNAKYVHTSLGLWYIYQYCRKDFPELVFGEYNINQDLGWVLGEIYLQEAAVVAFSCNIWNIEPTLVLCQRLKAIAPQTVIVLGGPEVWEEPVAVMEQCPAVDFVVIGEGEVTFKEWLGQMNGPDPAWETVTGLVYRSSSGAVRVNPSRPQIADLACLPTPYPEDLTAFRQKLVYYETSRGCPYQCQYCLSANEQGIRYFPLETVKRDFLRFIQARVAQVKLVDRSFNCNPRWAKELWRFLIEQAATGVTNFHFEIVGDLLDDESIAILQQAPPGLFQFEIGVQSVNPETLSAIRRKMDFERLSERVRQLIANTQVFVHLDLIAGLPYEDYTSFGHTFDRTLAIGPHRLQLGFLKLLRGSGLRKQAAQFQYRFTEQTPYEVLSNQWMAYPELLKLKTIEDLLERYYNSGRFQRTLRLVFSRTASAFGFFEGFARWWKNQGYDQVAHKMPELYRYLLGYLTDWANPALPMDVVRNLLKFDLLSRERLVELPDWAGENDAALKNFGYQFWKDPQNQQRFFDGTDGMEQREMQRRTLFARFTRDPLAADVAKRVPAEPETVIYLFVYRPAGVDFYRIDGRNGSWAE